MNSISRNPPSPKVLKQISREISAMGAGITAVGKRFALVGTAITAPMLAATRSWATSGAELRE